MNIDISTFVQGIASQFDETPNEAFSPSTKFRELEEWSSMMTLLVIAMVDEQYKVRLSGNDIKESNTIEDIFNKVIAKGNS